MFKSARIKLTFFYLAAIIAFTLISTLGTRYLAQVALDNSNVNSRLGLRDLIRSEVGLPLQDDQLNRLQSLQEDRVENQLNGYVIYINLLALVVGGIASYWFAGRTLRPIEDAHEAQARFASDASHELRTPLAVMRTENEVFLRQASFDKQEAREQIASNLEEVERLEHLATNLLALTNYEQGEGLELKTINSEAISKLAMESIKKMHPELSSEIKVDVQKVKVYGHVDSLAQALTIFMDNAIKYSPEKKEIKLSGAKQDDLYQFIIDDNGPGIAKEDMPYIFDRLYRSDKNRSKTITGHGLGLSLAKEIANANEAGLSVVNKESGGAQFILTLRII